MDWGTHVVLASKMLETCGLDRGAAIYSNLPAIDSKPPEYHRVYAHILENFPEILDAALEILGSDAAREHNIKGVSEIGGAKVAYYKGKLDEVSTPAGRRDLTRKVYAYTRITEEAPAFLELVVKAKDLLGDDEIGRISNDKLSAGLSFVTHLFFDTFNNPVQVFIPYSTLASAQWDLWDEIDYLRFREEFYQEENITRFRKETASSHIWAIKLKPEALIKAMIIRVGEQGRPAISYEAIDWVIRKFLRYMDVNEYLRVDKEIRFLRSLEQKITEDIKACFPKEMEE